MSEPNKQAMLLFVLSESVFFLILVSAYIFFHRPGGLGPTAASALDPVRTGSFSLALFGSSATMGLAGASLKRRRHSSGMIWLAVTILLGATFLIGQGAEYLHLLQHHVTISRNLFGTTFFTLTGFHGLHVLIGLIMLAILLGLQVADGGRVPTTPATEVVAVYWHFVDAVWIVIFGVVYLWGYLL